MPDLKTTQHEWSKDEQEANTAFYTALRVMWTQLVPWYKLDEPRSEAGAQKFRDMMKFGGGGLPAKVRLDDIAKNLPVPSRSGAQNLWLRVLRPSNTSTPSNGVYLHYHGGGWTVGSADGEDEILYRIACNTGYTVASMEYRMGPKYKYPAPIEDCLDAALFLLQKENEEIYGPLRVIGGESAGAHLSMVTAFGLRAHGYNPREQLDSLVFNYGCFDMGWTPSVTNWTDNLVLSKEDMSEFSDSWLAQEPDLRIAEISPLYNRDFGNMPPAIFVVGTQDPLYDDSLFGAMKWHMGGNETELVVFPDSYHGFCRLGGPDCEAGLRTSEAFVKKYVRK